jgi:F0F1-type ATP synthase assembly protein I
MPEKRPPPPSASTPKQQRALYAFAFRLTADFGVSIAVPAVAAALLGSWLDSQAGTGPRYLFILLLVALLSTGVTLTKKARRYGEEFQKLIE